MKLKALIAASASLAVVACAAGGLTEQGGTRAISQSAATEAARQHPQVLAEFGGAETGPWASYVSGVGRRVAAQSGVQGGASGWTVTTLNSPVMNAFAVPGGYVYITRQLLGLMDDEAELASVLGHEAGHIAADHSKGRENRGILTQLGALAVGVLTGSNELTQLASTVSQGLFLSYSRGQEFEADDLGVRYIAAAGYDPAAAASMLDSLGDATALEARASGANDERAVPTWARTHPLSADRVARARQKAAATGRAGQGLRNRDQFLAAIDGVMVGDDPRQGVVEGREFRHPDLRLRFTVPQGYVIQNGAQAVSISGSGGQAQFQAGSYGGNLASYISQAFQKVTGSAQVSVPQPRSTTVNGVPAAYSTARVSTQNGQVDLTIFAYQWDSNTAYHFALITPAGQGIGPFQPLVGSLARLSATEAAAIRPRVIDVVAVKAGDTPSSLASRMAYGDLKLERFLTLNSLESSARLTPGQKVKLVVYASR